MRPVGRTDNLTTFLCCLSRNSGSPSIPETKGVIQGHYFRLVRTNRGTDFEYWRLILWILILQLASWNRFCTQIFEVTAIFFNCYNPVLHSPEQQRSKLFTHLWIKLNLWIQNAVYRRNLQSCNAKYGNVSKEFMNIECSLSQEFREL